MRFSVKTVSNLFGFLRQPLQSWPLSLRVFCLFLPFLLIISASSFFFGYIAPLPSYSASLQQAQRMRPRILAERMESIFSQLRDQLLRVAHSPAPSLAFLQDVAAEIDRNLPGIIEEIGLKDAQGKNILLLRNEGDFHEIQAGNMVQGPYAAFQQVTSLPLYPEEVTLFPAVKTYYSTPQTQGQLWGIPVVRMATPFVGKAGTVVLGVNLHKLQQYFAKLVEPGGALFEPAAQGKATPFAYFFDAQGWILFEMDESKAEAPLAIDASRQGFSGDLGRSGLETAFRPWAVHEYFWYMVKSVQGGASGIVNAASDSLSPSLRLPFLGREATIAFSPVHFAPAPYGEPKVVGGFAFPLPGESHTAVLLRLGRNGVFALGVLVVVCLFFGLALHRLLGKPLCCLAAHMKGLSDQGELQVLEDAPRFQEHQRLLAAANSLIGQLMQAQGAREKLEQEMTAVRANLPVSLEGAHVAPGAKSLREEFGMVGSSTVMREMREQIRKAARAGTDMLIWGETGTGKELVAEAVHQCSSRHTGPFISINCGALDENLLLDVLFGHTKGAFTEAKTDRKGAFLAAEGGTLHLDEIGNASTKVQQALLRALAVRRIQPLGADYEVPFNVRVIAATNVDLREEVKNGNFREDLYYRLAIITIHTPPLRERLKDIPELVSYFLREFGPQMDKPVLRLSHGALERLMQQTWPGNVREFKNCVVRAIAFADADIILPEHIVLTSDTGMQHVVDGMGVSPSHAGQPGGTTAPTSSQGSVPVAGAISPQDAFAPAAPPALHWEEAPPVGYGFNARQRSVWPLIVQKGGITRQEYHVAAGTDVSTRTVQLDLKELVQWGLLQKVGAGAATRYRLCHSEASGLPKR